QRLEQAGVNAEIAAEKYNGALWRLGVAKRAVLKAERRSEAAKQEVADQRQEIALLVTQNYRSGPQIDQPTAMVHWDGVSTLMTTYGAVHGAGTSTQAKYDSYLAAKSRARVYEARAVTSRSSAAQLATAARADRDRATAAADDAQAQASSIAVQKSRLIKALAKAQGISTALARTRQAALEEQARARAEAKAKAQAEAKARQEAAARAQAAVRAKADAKAQAQAKAQAVAHHHHASMPAPTRAPSHPAPKPTPSPTPTPAPAPTPTPPPAPAPTPPPAPAPTPPPAPAPSGGAEAAIAYAKAQVGEPYQWGAAGPSSWDCSGLTMMAWAAAGRSLPHYTVAQYAATTHISAGQLRPGDLVFWGTTGSPGSIHHVAMYLGNGMILHAPRTGQDVQVVSMYYWIPPNFFGRP
ncbi:MAG: C40 family peptidase, partial [Marmoricola sp.]